MSEFKGIPVVRTSSGSGRKYVTPQDGKTDFVTRRVDPEVAKQLQAADVTFKGAVQNTWLTARLHCREGHEVALATGPLVDRREGELMARSEARPS